MRPYLSSYQGRMYEFIVVGIEETEGLDYAVLKIQNNENFRVSTLNSKMVYAPDYIEVGDVITRQYNREGVGIFGRYAGGYSSKGNTQYIDITSMDRWSKEHPIQANKNWIILIIFLIIILTILFG
ncbi:MAG: hypothetical protein ACRDBY_13020 [Cetobacterium sp.]